LQLARIIYLAAESILFVKMQPGADYGLEAQPSAPTGWRISKKSALQRRLETRRWSWVISFQGLKTAFGAS
jgi:hypothetical protein